mmetsp:Transcript_1748/g.2437  ORF Transcript_1748/g.2437 Transcript_1748/m.2437 type:complete len:101 (+) Transcript_1748:333-635(+)
MSPFRLLIRHHSGSKPNKSFRRNTIDEETFCRLLISNSGTLDLRYELANLLEPLVEPHAQESPLQLPPEFSISRQLFLPAQVYSIIHHSCLVLLPQIINR